MHGVRVPGAATDDTVGAPCCGQLWIVDDAGEDDTGYDSAGTARRAPRLLRLRHRAHAAELGRIRRLVHRWAQQNALPDAAVIDLQLALGEAVSNGVEHAYAGTDPGTVDVRLELRPVPGHGGDPGVVAVQVQDHGTWRPPEQPGYRGRGLALIGALGRRVQVASTAHGTQICFEIPLG